MKESKRMYIKAGVFTIVVLLLATTAVVIVNADFMPAHHPGFDMIPHQQGGQSSQSSTGDVPCPPGPRLTLSPTFADLGMYSTHSPQWITYSFDVTNTGIGTLTWSIDGFPWWVSYITINGQQGYGGSCTAGQTKTFVIHVNTGVLEDPYANDNLYSGTINLTSNVGDVTATAVIDMIDLQYPGHEEWEFSFPSNLQPGDLLFMDAKPWIIENIGVPHDPNNPDHVVLYYGEFLGTHLFIEANNYTIFNEHLNNPTLRSGVKFTPWWIFCFWAENFTIGKVNGATMQQISDAKLFERTRLRCHDKYQSAYPGYAPYWKWCNPNITAPSNPYYQTYYFPNDPFIDYWFCSELAWAAYLHATPPINLDAYPGSDGTIPGYGIPGYRVGPVNLYDSPNITIVDPNVN